MEPSSNPARKRGDPPRRNSVVRNSLFALLTSLSDAFFLLLLILAGRLLGAENFGEFSAALAFASILIYTSNLGLDSLAIRRIAIDRDIASTLMSGVLVWKLLLVAIVCIVYLPIAYSLSGGSSGALLLFLLCGAAVMRSFNITMRSFLQSFERFDIESAVVLGERVGVFALGILVLWLGYGAVALAAVFLIVRMMAFGAYLLLQNVVVCRLGRPRDLRLMSAFQLEALPLGVALILNGLYLQTDVLLLSVIRTSVEVGLFSAAFKIFEGLFVIPMVITKVVYPRLSAYFVSDSARHVVYFERTLKYVVISALPFAAVGLLFSEQIVVLLYGREYQAAAPVLAVLLVTLCFVFLSTAMHMIFRSTGHQRFVMHTTTLGLIMKIVLDLGMIPIWGIHGAAVAAAMSACAMVILALWRLRSLGYDLTGFYRNTAILVAAMSLVGMIVVMVDLSNLFASLLLLGGLYAASLFSFRIMDKDELQLFGRLVPIHRILSLRQRKR